MKHLERSDVLDLEAYESQRADLRREIKLVKACRRALLGPQLMFLFENHDTSLLQLQETLRLDNKTSEEEIARELEIHNERLPAEGELACTMLVQIEDLEEREVKLREWHDLPKHLFLVVDVGSHVSAQFDERQIQDGRLSSVQYVKFACGMKQPVALVCTRPGMEQRIPLEAEVQAALAEDLGLPDSGTD